MYPSHAHVRFPIHGRIRHKGSSPKMTTVTARSRKLIRSLHHRRNRAEDRDGLLEVPDGLGDVDLRGLAVEIPVDRSANYVPRLARPPQLLVEQCIVEFGPLLGFPKPEQGQAHRPIHTVDRLVRRGQLLGRLRTLESLQSGLPQRYRIS